MGAFSNGGRWNAPGAFPVVYGSTTASVALAESEANDRYFGIVCRKARLHVCMGMSFSRALDLTAAPVLRKLGLKARDLQAEDWRKINGERHESLTQCVGRAACVAGVEALLTSSACIKGGVNIAFFPGNKASSSKVFLHDEGGIKAMLSGRKP
jgi:RES domain-containing protein